MTLNSFYLLLSTKQLGSLKPKPNGDWLIERNEIFNTLIPFAGDTHKKFENHSENTAFLGYSRGYVTSRDVWFITIQNLNYILILNEW